MRTAQSVRLAPATIAAVVLALVAASVAIGQEDSSPTATAAAGEGRAIEGGERNPAHPGELRRETQIIAQTPRDTYGTRQSNKGAGGGAIYGCRAALDPNDALDPERTTPCIRANNLRGGEAFQFNSNGGSIVGAITVGSGSAPVPGARPFITNATGIALGLNADMLDGKHADEIIAEARQGQGGGSTQTAQSAERADRADEAGNADTLDGRDSSDFEDADTVQTSGLQTVDEGDEVTLFEHGPLTVTGRCVDDGGLTSTRVAITTTENNSAAAGDDNSDGDLDSGEEVLVENNGVSDSAGGGPDTSDGYDDQWWAFSPSGDAINGTVAQTADTDTEECRFFGTATIAG